MIEPIRELVQYRFRRAEETLEDAHLLAESERWNSCVNRLYYACFYAVSAVLLRAGHTSAKHTGIRSLFNQHFVKAGLVEPQLGRIFNELFRHRQKSDYADLVNFEPEEVRSWLSQADRLVSDLAGLIHSDRQA